MFSLYTPYSSPFHQPLSLLISLITFSLIPTLAPGPSNVIARRVVDELLEFSGESSVSKALTFFNAQQIVEHHRFANRMRDEVEISETLIGQLNALIAELEGMEDQGELFDTLMSLREDRRNENAKMLALNELIAQVMKEIEDKEAQVDAANDSG
ncbi:hypothetical protein Tco_1337912 [Tanacetum coccineum]